MSFNLRELRTAMRGLTQSFYLRSDDALQTGTLSVPFSFVETMKASPEAYVYNEFGAVKEFDPVKATRILAQYSRDSRVGMDVINTELRDAYTVLSRVENQLDIATAVLGRNDRTSEKNKLAKVAPATIQRAIRRILPDASWIVLTLLTQYMCKVYAPLGVVLDDAAYVYRLSAESRSMDYAASLRVVESWNSFLLLRELAATDLRLVYDYMDTSRVLSPATIASQIAAAMARALHATRLTFDAKTALDTFLVLLLNGWDPEIELEHRTPSKILTLPFVKDAMMNLGWFEVAQEYARDNRSRSVSVARAEITDDVISPLSEAFALLSPFRRHPISEVISALGTAVVRAPNGFPTHIALYESWELSDDVPVFRPVIRYQGGKDRYLVPQPLVESRMSAAIKPIKAMVSVERIVEQRLETLSSVSVADQMSATETEVIFMLPSFHEQELADNLPSGSIARALRRGTFTFAANEMPSDEQEANFQRQRGNEIVFDTYSLVNHLAVHSAMAVSIAFTEVNGRRVPYIVFDIKKNSPFVIGESAVIDNAGRTTEPFEALAYANPVKPTRSFSRKFQSLSDFEENVHLWPWWLESDDVNLTGIYTTNLDGHAVSVSVSDYEMLGLAYKPDQIRAMIPTSSRAVVKLWIDSILEDAQTLETRAEDAGSDSVDGAAAHAARQRSTMSLALLLLSLGRSGAGQNIKELVLDRVRDQLRGQRPIDAMAPLVVGAENHKLLVWSGLLTLRLMNLIDAEQISAINAELSSQKVLSLIVSAETMLGGRPDLLRFQL